MASSSCVCSTATLYSLPDVHCLYQTCLRLVLPRSLQLVVGSLVLLALEQARRMQCIIGQSLTRTFDSIRTVSGSYSAQMLPGFRCQRFSSKQSSTFCGIARFRYCSSLPAHFRCQKVGLECMIRLGAISATVGKHGLPREEKKIAWCHDKQVGR